MSELNFIPLAENEVKALEAETVQIADSVETKVIGEIKLAEAGVVAEITKIEGAVEKDIVAPVENLVAAAEQEVKKVVAVAERTFHPEVGQTRPVINTTLPHGGGSVLKNPA